MFRRSPSEREIAEKNLAKSGIPEFRSPSRSYQGKGANYIVKNGYGKGRDRRGVAYVIAPGGKTLQQEQDEEEIRIERDSLF